jgi:predicted metal-dependent peptidase
MDQREFNKHLVAQMATDPFYAAISRRIRKIRSFDVPTAGVGFDNEKVVMHWNPDFFGQLESQHVKGVLKHEFLHIIEEHICSRKKENALVWNLATDCAINCLITAEHLPDCAIIPGTSFKNIPKGQEKLARLIESLPRMKSSEWYYNRLIKEEDALQELTDGKHKSGSGSTDDNPDPYDGMANIDNHDGWQDSVDSVERTVIREEIRSVIRDAVREVEQRVAKGLQAWGDVPTEMQTRLKEFCAGTVDWRTLLRMSTGMAKSRDKRSTRTRRNRKYGLAHPGKTYLRRSRVLVAIDESGSVSNDDISLLFGELNKLAKEIEITVIHFDTLVDDNVTSYKRGEKITPIRYRSGGTDFNAPTDWANKHASQFDTLFILTDGQAAPPTQCKIKRTWILTPGCKLYFDTRELQVHMGK